MDNADLADKQIEDDLRQAIFRCGTRMASETQAHSHCIECDSPVPEARRRALPNVRICVACAEARERHARYTARAEMRLDNWLSVE